jgi:hypothetical protein
MAVLPTGIGPVTGYNIERSLRFNSADTAYLNRTPGSTGNRRTFTFSFWVKRSTLDTIQTFFQSQDDNTVAANSLGVRWQNTNAFEIYEYSSAYRIQLTTTQVFRDPSAWYHIVVAIDTTQATASNRVKLYVNGSQITAFGTATYPTQNTDLFWNVSGQACFIGRYFNGTTALYYLNGYMTEINFIDGQALTPSNFGETDTNTGVWKPKAYSGTYGTNGFYLKFADNSGTTSTTLGKDSSGNGNNWTPNLFSVTAGTGNDSLVDSPTSYGGDTGAGGEVRGNYCTWNPLKNSTTLSDGNLRSFNSSTTQWLGVVGTFGMTSGKWYWECTPTVAATVIIGLANSSYSTGGHPGSDANSWGYYSANGNKYFNNSGTSYGATYTANDVIGVAFDADAGTLTFYKNGVSQGTAYSSLTSGPYFPAVGVLNSQILFINAGQRPFQKWNGSAYVANTAPSGFKALCTQNLPTPTIGATSTTQAGKYFNAVTYTGNGTDGRAVTGVGFNPDLVWVKGRSNAGANVLADAVRGSDKNLYTNLTDAETNPITGASGGGIGTVTTDGFVLEQGTVNMDLVNTSARTYVAWNWNAGGSNATNTSGTITSTVRANTTAGFSIVTYDSNPSGTVGHGLGAVPKMIIEKKRDVSSDWLVGHSLVDGSWDYLRLNLTDANANAAVAAPTSTVFTPNASGDSMVAYCFAPVPGYSAFGSYTGNGSTDGPFVYTNFRPRYVMVKRTDTTGAWVIWDSARDTYNAAEKGLLANASNAEDTTNYIDFLSNGFKLRNTFGSQNASGGTYIYAAFAEVPTKFSLAR